MPFFYDGAGIPLYKIAPLSEPGPVQDDNWEGLIRLGDWEFDFPFTLPVGCYGLEISQSEMEPTLRKGDRVVISPMSSEKRGGENLLLVKAEDRVAFIAKKLREDTGQAKPSSVNPVNSKEPIGRRRKSFMTPTPLHIPSSRVSPIPDSTHQMILFKSLSGEEPLIVIPSRKIQWMHSLIYIPGNK